MLQRISDKFKTGSFAAIMVALVGFALAFTGKGLSDRFNITSGPDFAAKVDGTEISVEAARNSWRDAEMELSRDRALTDAERKDLQDQMLESLIVSELLNARAVTAGYRASPAKLQQEIRSEPSFQIDGQYNETLALSRLAQIGVTAEQYRIDVARRLREREIQQAVGLSEFVTPVEFGRRLALDDEQRKVAVMEFPREKFRSWVVVNDAALNEWFTKNNQRYFTPESASVQFAALGEAEVSGLVVVTEEDLKAEYAKNLDKYQEPERRRIRHILLSDDASAQKVLAELRAGADFSAVAQRSSKDTASAAVGGDLGLSEKTVFVPAFADAAFAAKVGAVVGPVKTEFGFHVIRVDEIQPGRRKAFEDVRAELDAALRSERTADFLADREDQAQRLIAEAGADVGKIANQLGMRIVSVQDFVRGIGGGEFVGDNSLSDAAFSEEALVQRRIVGPVASRDGFVILKVLDHRKPKVPPMADIKSQVMADFVSEKADQLALAQAQEVAKRVSAGEFRIPVEGKFVDRRDPSLSQEVRRAAFALKRPSAGRPEASATVLSSGGAAVVVVDQTRAVAAGVDPAQRALRGQSVQVASAISLLQGYLQDLRQSADIEKHPDIFSN